MKFISQALPCSGLGLVVQRLHSPKEDSIIFATPPPTSLFGEPRFDSSNEHTCRENEPRTVLLVLSSPAIICRLWPGLVIAPDSFLIALS